MTPQPLQAGAAAHCGPAWSTGAPLIALRPSVWLRGVTVASILIASAAFQTCLAARVGMWPSVPAALAVLALLGMGALRHWRNELAAIKIGPDGLVAWNRAGELIAQGIVSGCSQWSGLLLVLAVTGSRGRTRSLLIMADSLPAEAFRELAVLGRHAAHG